jgi:uncharacterized protein (DUF4415 family)
MRSSKPLTDPEGEVRDLSVADLRSFRTAAEVLPASLLDKLKVRGVQKAPTKERITIRLSPEVLARFRSSGDGWQTRMDSALKEWLQNHEPARG